MAESLTFISDGIGEPRKAPCVSCHISGSECILIDSRRGGNFRHKRSRTLGNLERSTPSLKKFSTSKETSGDESSNVHGPSQNLSHDIDSDLEQGSGDVLSMELRNPSDALQILARSGETQAPSPSPARTALIQNATNIRNGFSRNRSTSLMQNIDAQQQPRAIPAFFEDYELVQRGLLRPSLVSKLLFTSVK